MAVKGVRALILGAGAVFATSCGNGEATLEPCEPVLVVGIDGVDPGVLATLIDAGRVPTFARFAEEGSLGRLDTFAPTFSPAIWTTIATGQASGAHGVNDFLNSEGLPFTSNTRRVPALWDLASAAGRTVDCTGWWVTWPAERINGRMVASYAAQAQAQVIWKPTVWDKLEKQTWPPELQAEIKPFLTMAGSVEELHGPMRSAFPIPAEVDDHTGPIIRDLAWTFAADLSVSRVAGHLLDTGGADLSMCYLAMPDVAGHRFWNYFRPGDMRYEVSAQDQAAFGDFINLAYIEADRMLGELIAKAPANTTVVVVSDHGMHADPLNTYNPTAIASGAHEDAPAGIIGVLGPKAGARGNRLATGASMGNVDQVAPMVLHMLGVGVPQHWPGVQRMPMAIESNLDEAWRVDNQVRLVANGESDFRAATPAELPGQGMNTDFITFLEGIGYLGDVSDPENHLEQELDTPE